jgi:aspartate kinase
MLKITKFGGSSVADAAQFRKVKAIVEADPSRRYVVVSAAGRRFPSDAKVTDLLYLVDAHRTYHVDSTQLLDDIEGRFASIASELGLSFPVHEEFQRMRDGLKGLSAAYIISRGEWFTAQLMAEYLGRPFVDAAGVVVFHHNGELDLEATCENVRELAAREETFVFPGFYGTTADGDIRLMERGGGDITGAILAQAIDADLYENWTDVSGFLSADPKIVDNPRPIRRITFDEMRELSYMGASVLHEDAIFPVRDAGIPIQIKNTNDPEALGTTIRETAESSDDEHLITGVAGKKGYLSIYISKTNLSREHGIIARTLAIFARYGLNVEHVPTGVDSFWRRRARRRDHGNAVYSLMADIKDEVQRRRGQDAGRPGAHLGGRPQHGPRARALPAGIFTALGDADINISMITQSSQEITIIMGVDEDDFEDAIRVIYDKMVRDEMVQVAVPKAEEE